MLNAGRWLDLAIFTLESPVTINGVQLSVGLQQVHRIEKNYYFSKIGENPYAIIPIEFNESVVKTIFTKEIIDP